MKIAVVGAGIPGLTAAHYLQHRHEVVLFEAERRPGGHTHTVDVMEGDRPISIDTGFIVFNTKTYPNFVKLLGELGVAWAESEMSFSVRSARRDFEYAGASLSTLFTQRIGEGSEIPIRDWLEARHYSTAFIEDHLYPMVRAVWSANREIAERFPARFLARFFENHGFLQITGAPRWLTIPGGSRSYVRAILSGVEGGAVVSCEGAVPERFDHLILACHSDQALALLTDASRSATTS